MKSFVWTIGGICAAAAGFLVWNSRRVPHIELMAEQLEHAWSDHHTRA